MLSWADAILPFVVAVAVIFVPGLLVGSAAGATRWHRWALAAPISFTIAGLGAVLFALIGVPFTTLSFAVSVVVVSVVVWGVRRLLGRRLAVTAVDAPIEQADAPAPAWVMPVALIVGLGVSAGMIGTRLLRGIGSPTAIAQLFDNVFHLNAVALIFSSGNGSSLTLGNLTDASRGFYPAAFHDVTAVVMGMGVSDVSVALNVVSITMAALVWPVSLVFLATRLFGARPQVVVVAGLCGWLFAAFPYRLFSFGVLYPFMAGLTMASVLVALVVEFFRARAARGRALAAAGIVAAAPGIALTHPSVVVAALVLASPFVIRALVEEISHRGDQGRDKSRLALGTAYLLGTFAAFMVIRPPLSTAPWDPTQSPREAVGSIALMSPGTGNIGWMLIPLAAVGVVTAIRRPRSHGVVLSMAAIGATLYFASAAMWHPLVRDLLAGVWYRDTERVAALFAIACIPIVLLGTLTIFDSAARAWGRIAPGRARSAQTIIVLVVIGAVILVVGQRGAIAQAQSWLSISFGQAGTQHLLTDDERELLEEVPEFVPPGDVVLGDAATGASLTPAFSDRKALTPHIFGARSREEKILLNRWEQAGTDPRVCQIIRDLHAYWALDFGTDGVLLGNERPELYGLDQLDDSPGIVEVARVGDAVLYEAAACR